MAAACLPPFSAIGRLFAGEGENARLMKKWMTLAALLLVVAGCTKHTVRERDKTDVPDGKTVEVTLRKRSDWTLQYIGREDYTEDNNRKIRVEHIKVACPGADYYILRTITAADLRDPDIYNNDRKAFFEEEARYIRQDASYYGDKVTDYFYIEEMHDYLLDRMRMGDWVLFLIGMDKDGYITGDYAELAFTLNEETATEEYLRWIGEWTVTGGGVSYPLRIEQSEANCAYFVHGWETGNNIDPNKGTVMDQEYLETYFDVDNLNMYFTSQYLGTYEENGVNMDELFLGKVNITNAKNAADNGIRIITDEGLDLAAATLPAATPDKATITGCDVSIYIGNDVYATTFLYMQYIAAYMNGNEVEYKEYNDNVPAFPLTMTRKAAAPAFSGTRADTAPAFQPRPVTRASIHHAQPRVHGETGTRAFNGTANRALHAVRAAR